MGRFRARRVLERSSGRISGLRLDALQLENRDIDFKSQKYHSIAARGEKVPTTDVQPNKPELPSKAAAMLNGTLSPPPQSQAQKTNTTTSPANFIGPALPAKSPAITTTAPPPAAPPGLASLSQTLLGASKLQVPRDVTVS